MHFSEYLLNNIDEEWREHYINYNKLKHLIDNIISLQYNSEKYFCKFLDNEWIKYYNFINKTIRNLCNKDLDSGNIVIILRINNFIHLNREGFRKIIKKHDKNSNYTLYPAWKWKIRYNPTFKLYPALNKISKLYKKEDNSEDTINNSSFKRTSIKFWVKKDNVVPVICNILPHLPIHLWDEDINEHIYQATSSVYFDNINMDCYNSRIHKEEDSKLVRIRWYGEDMDNVFVERKVHHDSWTLLESSKDRFQMNANDILTYIRGDTEKKTELELEIHDEILSKELYPKIRTVYKRIAFQLKHTNDIRISLDVDLKMIKEKTGHLEWFTDEDNILDSDVYRFPYAILEIKLAENNVDHPPEWIEELMNSTLVIKQPMFSKFIHSCYHFFGNKCDLIPHWIAENKEDFILSWENSKSICATLSESESISSDTHSENTQCNIFNCRRNKNRVAEPIKIEPKTFFANERTFLQWFNSGVFVSTGGLTIMGLADTNVPGIMLIVTSILIMLYSTIVYYRRNDSLVNRYATGYNDLYGPLILTFIMIISLILSVIFYD